MTAPRLVIAVPCYNNGSLVGAVLSDLAAIAAARREHQQAPFELIVIDDGSTDDSHEVCAQHPAQPTILRHRENRGKGAAIATAIAHCQQDQPNGQKRAGGQGALITVDGDGQHTRPAIEALLAAAEREPQRLWLGARQMAGDPNIPGSSRFGRQFSNGWVWIETGRWLEDTQTGLRSYPLTDRFYDVATKIRCRHYDFEIAILVQSLWAGITVTETSVPVYYPPPRERVSHFDAFWDNARLSRTHSRLVAQRLWQLSGGWLWTKIKALTGIAGDEERKGSRVTGWLMAKGGKWLCLLLAVFPVGFYFLADSKARRGIASLYRRLSLGQPSWQALPRSFKNFWWFALSIIDRIDFAQGTKRLPQMSKVPGTVQSIRPGSIVLASHIGDWLFGGLRLTGKASQLAILADPGRTPEFLRQIKGPNGLPVTLVDSRQDPIPLILSLRETLAAGGVVCVMADRLMAGNTPLPARFLGAEADFPEQPFRLAQLLAAPVYAFCATRSRGGLRASYALHIEELSPCAKGEDTAALLSRYVQFLEERLKEGPHHWFNFFPFWKSA